MRKILIISLFLLILPYSRCVRAKGFIPDCDVTDDSTGKLNRPCNLNDFLVLAINLINYMLAISGSLALFFFVYGGFKMLLSAGNSEKVAEGKEMISAAIIGILIVLASWLIVNAVYSTLIEGGSKWWQIKT